MKVVPVGHPVCETERTFPLHPYKGARLLVAVFVRTSRRDTAAMEARLLP